MLVPLADVADLLREPGKPGRALELTWRDGELLAARGQDTTFPLAAAQPVLVDFSRSVCREEWYADARPTPSPVVRRPPFARALKGRLTGSARVSRTNLSRLRASLPPHASVLMVGAGSVGAGCEALYGDHDVRQIAFDIYPSAFTQFVADAHDIPLADASVDAVVVQAVLEHVLEPAAVVSEIHRVLRPGGLVYAETPFLQHVHEGAYDFTRFTELGHRWLWRRFDPIARGVIGGPGLTLYWSVRLLARAAVRSHRLGDVLSLPFLAFSLMDRFIPSTYAVDGANGVYFLGRRSAGQSVSEDGVADEYLGAGR